MDKKQFLSDLERSLGNISGEEKKDILYDYEEHFTAGLEAGKTEDEIARGLGNPSYIARQYRADYLVKQAEENKSTGNIVRAVLAIIGLGFFNLIIVLGPFLGAVGLLMGFFATGLAVTITGIAGFFAFILSPLSLPFIQVPAVISSSTGAILGGILLSLGVTALGLLICMGIIYLSKWFYNLTIRYLKLNISIATGREVS